MGVKEKKNLKKNPKKFPNFIANSKGKAACNEASLQQQLSEPSVIQRALTTNSPS